MPTAATVYISESNGAGEVVTHDIDNINLGSIDAPNLDPSLHQVIVSEYSYAKYERVEVASLGDSTTIKDLRCWASVYVPVTGERLRFNCFATASAAIPYATPTTASIITATIGTSDPGSANIDIGGDLAGQLLAPGYSGYFLFQAQSNVGGTTPVGPANVKVIVFQFDET